MHTHMCMTKQYSTIESILQASNPGFVKSLVCLSHYPSAIAIQ